MDVRNVFDSVRAIRVRGEGAFKMAGEPRGQGTLLQTSSDHANGGRNVCHF